MPNLDTVLAESKQRADDLERQERTLGRYLNDPLISATHSLIGKAKEMGEKVSEFVTPGAEKAGQMMGEDLGTVGQAGQTLQDQLVTPIAEQVTSALGITLPDRGGEIVSQAFSGLPSGSDALSPEAKGAMTALAAVPFLGTIKKAGAPLTGLIRPRFQVEGIVERALNPAPLAEKVTETLNAKTAVLTDEQAIAKSQELLATGGVTMDTLVRYAPGTAAVSPAHSLAAAELVTNVSRTFLDTARTALATNDPQLVDQALTQLAGLIDPHSSHAGAITTTAQTLRLATSEDLKAANLIMERASKLTEGMSPLDQLRFILADKAADPAAQGKSVTQSFRNLTAQAKEIVASGDESSAQVFLHEVQTALDNEAQLGLFPTEKEVKDAQKVIKNVTAQHIVEANQAAAKAADKEAFALSPTGPSPVTPKQTTFLLKPIKAGDQITDDQIKEFNKRLAVKEQEKLSLTPTTSGKPQEKQLSLLPKPIKPGQQLTNDQLREYNKQVAEAAQEQLRLTSPPGGAASAKGKQQDLVADEEKNRLATIKEHQAQDMRVSEGTSVFSPKREPFKLTPPPGGAKAPKTPKQLDLLNIIAKEPQPEQLALEMAASVENPELSKQFLSMIRKAQDAITFGKTEEVGKILSKIQGSLTPPVKPAGTVSQPTRLVEQEKKALASFLQKHAGANLSPAEMLKAFVSDPELQPDALISAINNAKNPTWRDAWQYLVINSMLGPASDFVNFTATASMMPVHIAARTAGARYGQAARLMGGKAGVIVGEDEAMIHGLFASFWDSVKLAGRVAKTNIPEIGPGAVRETQLGQNPMSAEAMFGYSSTARKIAGVTTASDAASSPALSRAGIVSRAIDTMGVVFGLPGRFMLTGDQFIQNMAMAAEQHALVYRRASEQAIREGLSEAEFYKLYGPLWRSVTKNLPADIREKGEQFSLEVSLNQQLGPMGQTALNLRETVDKYTGIGGTIALPFFKTLVNSSKATWEFSPLAPTSQALGLIAKQFRSDMFGDDPVKRDIAMGKWAVGTMMMSSMLWAAVNGRLRGRGPDNKELKREYIEAEGLPDSLVINADDGTSIQINRLGIVANLAGMAADSADVWLQADEHTKGDIAQLLVTAYVGNLSFDFLQNSSGVIQAIANGVKTKEDLDLLAKSLTKVIPLTATVRSIEKLLSSDENPVLIKDARATLDKILATFPGYDALAKQFDLEPVNVLRNQFGYAVKQPRSAWGTEWFNPLHVSTPSQQPGLADLSAIELELGVAVQQPSRYVGSRQLPLTNKEYDVYQQLAGEQWEARALKILPTLQREDVSDQRKRDLIESHLRASRATAAHMLFRDEPAVSDAVVVQKRYLANTLRTKKEYDRP